MRRVISLILVIVFGIPSLFGVGLHALMPHGVGGSSHVHSVSLGSRGEASHECACDSSHDESHEYDSDASGINWYGCRGFACHGADCVICLFCMSHKTTLVFAASAVTNIPVVRLFVSPGILLEQVQNYTPCGRGPPLIADLFWCC